VHHGAELELDPLRHTEPMKLVAHDSCQSAVVYFRVPVTTRPAGDSVKAIKSPLSCFVGRLDPETTADDLNRYLEEVGIKDADWWKMQAKDGTSV